MKTKTHVNKSGSWSVFLILLICFGWNLFFIPLLYWLLKIRKTKTYTYH